MTRETKTCTKCNETKPLDAFYVARNGKASGDRLIVKSRCKACQSAAAREWQKNNRERHTRNVWLRDLKRNYGLTEAEWLAMVEKAGHRCELCGEEETNAHQYTGTVWRLSVDHCHATGKIRGILCNTCNRAMGLFNDNPQLLRKAADYLEKGGYHS